MRSYPDSIPSSRNAFSPSFLRRLGERDEPTAAGEADVAGPWHVEEVPGGFGLFRSGESLERGFRPQARFRDRWLALLTAAVLPGTGRDAAFRLRKEADAEGFALEDGADGAVLGHFTLFDESLADALNVAASLSVSPPPWRCSWRGPARCRWSGPARSWKKKCRRRRLDPSGRAVLSSRKEHADPQSHHGRPPLPRARACPCPGAGRTVSGLIRRPLPSFHSFPGARSTRAALPPDLEIRRPSEEASPCPRTT